MTTAVRLGLAVVLILFGTLYLLNALQAATPWINHDVGYHTYLGEEMTRGHALYVDLKEDNPPGNPLLLGLVARAGNVLRLPDFFAPHLFLLLVGACGAAVLARAFDAERESTVLWMTCLAYALLIVRPGYANNLYPDAHGLPYDFAQREHLFSLLFVPYLFVRLRVERPGRGFLAFAAAVGYVATFKPFWPVMALLVEAFAALRRKRVDLRVAGSLAAGMLLPLVGLAAHSTVALRRFLTENIPMYLRGGYDYYETSYASFLRTPLHHEIVAGAFVLALVALLARARGSAPRAEVGLLLGMAAFAYFALWHQGKFWSYHALPVFALTIVPAAFLSGSVVQGLPAGRARRPWCAGYAAAAGAALVATLLATSSMLQRYPPLGSFLVPAAQRYERVMYFSMSVMVQYPPLLLDREMVGPWTVLLDLPERIGIPDAERRERALEEYFAAIREEIAAERPELLVFSPQAQALPQGTTLHDWLVRYDAIPRGRYREVTALAVGVDDPRARGWRFYLPTGVVAP